MNDHSEIWDKLEAGEGPPPSSSANPSEGWEGLRHDDIDNSERFVRLHGERIRYVRRWKRWLVWDDSRWVEDSGGAMTLELAKDVPRTLYEQASAKLDKDLGTKAAALSQKHKLEAMVHLARGVPGVIIDHDELDADPWALGVRNGWVDLRTGVFHEPDPAKLMTMQTPVAWERGAHAPLWEKCLAEWLPDPLEREYFQRLCGASVVGLVRDHLLIIVYGRGGNGKGTALNTIAEVLGPYHTVPHKSLLISDRFDQHATVKATLFRVRMAVAGESDRRVKLNEASVKELTGGDLLRARRMREDEWSFQPSHTLWLHTNHKPDPGGMDEGLWRRIKLFPWNASFVNRPDLELPEKLRQEAPGILNWLIEAAIKWQTIGLGPDTVPPSVREATSAYRNDEDKIARWIADEGWVLGPQYLTPTTELSESYFAWHRTNHGGSTRFNEVAEWLQEHDCEKLKPVKTTDSEGKRRQVTNWRGIGRT